MLTPSHEVLSDLLKSMELESGCISGQPNFRVLKTQLDSRVVDLSR